MRGRIQKVKKSVILEFVFVLNTLLFLTGIALNIFLFKSYPSLWFFVFCFCVGTYQILKSRFLKLDSGFYLGTLLLLISISGFVFLFTHTTAYSYLYIEGSFFLSSLLTFFVCGQRFHLIICYLIFFVIMLSILFVFSLVSLPILIAISVLFLLLLVVITIFSFWSR